MWTPETDAALQRVMCEAPVLAYPHFNLEFRLKTDASSEALGAVLSQEQDGAERPIEYASRRLNKAEQNYSTTEREALAIVWAIDHFRPYVYGRHFKVITDHKPLVYLRSIKEPKGRQARWLQELSQYEFTVEHQPGHVHVDADALSRRPATEEESLIADDRATEDNPDTSAQDTNSTALLAATGWQSAYTLEEIREL